MCILNSSEDLAEIFSKLNQVIWWKIHLRKKINDVYVFFCVIINSDLQNKISRII